MTTLLETVTAFMTAAYLLFVIGGVIGKVPGRLVCLAAIAATGICLLIGIFIASPYVIVLQSVAFVSWTLVYASRRYAARRAAG